MDSEVFKTCASLLYFMGRNVGYFGKRRKWFKLAQHGRKYVILQPRLDLYSLHGRQHFPTRLDSILRMLPNVLATLTRHANLHFRSFTRHHHLEKSIYRITSMHRSYHLEHFHQHAPV